MTDDILDPIYALDPGLVNRVIERKLGQRIFGVYGSYDNELGQQLLELAASKNIFGPASVLDPELARRQINAALFEGGGTYIASAVHFDGSANIIRSAALTTLDAPVGLLSLWVHGDTAAGLANNAWFGNRSQELGNGCGVIFYYITSDSSVFLGLGGETGADAAANWLTANPTIWTHYLLSWNTNFDNGQKRLSLYVNDTLVAPDSTPDLSGAFDVGYTASGDADFPGFFVGANDDPPGTIGDFSDIFLSTSHTIVQADGTISVSDRRNFIDGSGKPVNPATAVIAYGTPACLFSGDAASFATNQGSGGPFVLNGSLTDASTSPSDDIVPYVYVAQAVHFDGATFLSNNALVSTDNTFISYSFWMKSADTTIDTTIFVVDPNGNYATFSGFSPSGAFANRASDADDSESADYTGADGTLADTNWHHWLVCIRADNTAPPLLGAVYLDDVLVPNVASSTHNPLPAIATNGLLMMVGDDPFDNHFFGDFADLRIMPGTNLLDGSLTIPTGTRRLFIDGSGKPVNPATATATLGTPCVLFSGDASSFVTNQGSGGPFTLTGALTDASTSPSDDS